LDIKEKALKMHEEWKGKIEITSRAPVESREDLSIAYTGRCRAVFENKG